jgi:replicative DNA helicase
VPTIYKEANRQARIQILQGILDTDGWAKGPAIGFSSASETLADDVVYLARSLGAWASKTLKQPHYTYKGQRLKGRTAYCVSISHPKATEFFSLRKADEMTSPVRLKNVAFASIEPIREAQAQCITVSHPQRLYITDDFVVTHNSVFAQSVSLHIALGRGGNRRRPVLINTLEMTRNQVTTRLLCAEGQVDGLRVRCGNLSGDEWGRLWAAREVLLDAPIWIDDTRGPSVADMASRARKVTSEAGEPLGLLVIDHLQFIAYRGPDMTTAGKIGVMMQGLKGMAAELGCPILLVSHLNRAVQGTPRRPTTSRLKESSSIEQDSDEVLFLFEGDPQIKLFCALCDKVPTKAGMCCDQPIKKVETSLPAMEIIVAKARGAELGSAWLYFDRRSTRFDSFVDPRRADWRTA